MRKETLNKLGLAAVILLAPGGFILGATLAANHYRKKARGTADARPAATGGDEIQPAAGGAANSVTRSHPRATAAMLSATDGGPERG